MPSGPTHGGGGLDPTTDPAHFPSDINTLMKKTIPQVMIHNSSQSAVGVDTYTSDYDVASCDGFTIYVSGTGSWNVQVAPHSNNNESFWVDLISSDKSGKGYYSCIDRHPHVRVVIKSGANLIVWLYRRYPAY
jgi:hypothetical protein